MGKVRRTSAIVLVLVMVFMTASCGKSKGSGSGVGNKMMIYAADHSDEYVGAAKQYFNASFVTSSDPQTEELTKDNKIGFVAVISSDENILKRKPTDGRQFTALVFDDGSSNIKVALMYRMGTTDKCVAKGNVSGGALLLTNSFEINAAGINDYSKRAEFIFKNVFEQAEKVK